jgi:flagellar biogenesis protein FliO
MDGTARLLLPIFLLCVLGLFWYLLRQTKSATLGPLHFLFRRTRNAKDDPDSCISIVSRLYLGPHHALYLISVMGSRVLLCTHPQGCSVVTDLASASQTPERLSQ